MKTLCEIIGKFIRYTALIYSGITLSFLAVAVSFSIKETPDWTGIFLLFLQILLFSALTSLFHVGLGAIKKLNAGLRTIICAVLTYCSFYLCFFAMVNGGTQPINILVVSTLFFVVYAVLRGIGAVWGTLASRRRAEKEEYTSVYGDAQGVKKED